MGKFTDTETSVQLAVPVSQKISLGIMMMGALSALFAIALGLYEIPREKTQNVSGSFKPLQLSDGAPSTIYIQDSGVAEFQFFRDGVLMATYNKTSGFDENENLNIQAANPKKPLFIKEALAATLYSIEGDPKFKPADNKINMASKSPLQVKLSQSAIDKAVIPAMTFSLVTNIGSKTLCLPAKTLNKNGVVSYYYDVDGTPYLNSALTQKAMAGKCTVNTQAYAPTDISAVTITPEYPQEVPNGFGMYFTRYDQSLMIYTQKTFQDMEESVLIAGGKSPLGISTGYYDPEKAEITVPARILMVETNLGTHNLCLPEQTIAGTWSDADKRYLGKGATYYIDKNGTPYLDEILTEMATTKPCNQLLANALVVETITSVEAGIVVDIPGATARFYENTTDLGSIDLTSGIYSSMQGVIGATTPLYISLFHNASETKTMPANLLTVSAHTPTAVEDVTYTLCLPETAVPAGINGYVLYYFDKNGNPYSDSLLEKAASCEPPPKITNTNTSIPTQTD